MVEWSVFWNAIIQILIVVTVAAVVVFGLIDVYRDMTEKRNKKND